MNDLIDIGVRDKNGKFLYLAKHRIKNENSEFKNSVSFLPHKAGIDPLNKLTDKVSSDNEIKIQNSESL